MIAAARAHLARCGRPTARPTTTAVWRAYVALNNAARDYDELLNDVFGEVTPWDLEAIPADEADERSAGSISADAEPDWSRRRPVPAGALGAAAARLPGAERVRAAAGGRGVRRGSRGDGRGAARRSTTVARGGAGAAAGRRRLARHARPAGAGAARRRGGGGRGGRPLDPDAARRADGEAPFRLGPDDRTLARLDERPFPDLDDDGEVAGAGGASDSTA